MTLAIATTTVTFTRWDLTGDSSTAPDTPSTEFTVDAHVSAPSGHEQYTGGSQEVTSAVCLCEVADVAQGDLAVDHKTGRAYRVSWTNHRVGLGLDHMQIGLTSVVGVSRG